MIDNILTNYNIKFNSEQLDCDKIFPNKSYYKIYNNKIDKPLQKFWFSLPNVKFNSQFSNYKTIRFLINNKSENTICLLNFIEDLSNHIIKLFEKTYSNITVDLPWKINQNFPTLLTLFTNNETLLMDSESNTIDYSSLLSEETYSIIFEITNLKIISINLDNEQKSNIIKINLSLLLVKTIKKIDFKNYTFNSFVASSSKTNTDNNIYTNPIKKSLPFLSDISTVTLKNIDSNTTVHKQHVENLQKQKTNILVINQAQILQAKNTLKKVILPLNNYDQESDDNKSVVTEYVEKKNELKKVKTKVKTLLDHLDNKKKKKKSKQLKDKEKDFDLEFEKELEKELESKL